MKTKTFTGIEQIIQILSQNKNAIKVLYSYRDVDYPLSNFLDEISRENMDLLENYGVIEIDDTDNVSLSDDYCSFFENILDNAPVSSYLVKDSLDKLKRCIKIYVTLERDSDIKEYSKKIRKNLKNILSRTKSQIINISNEVEIEYRSEQNLETKLQMLEHLYITINELQSAIEDTNHLINEKEDLFIVVVGDVLYELRRHFSSVMKEIVRNLNILMAYINKVQRDIEVLRKTRKIADIINKNQLESMTNIKQVIENMVEMPLGFGPKMSVYGYVPLDLLKNTDEGQTLIEKTREYIRIKSKDKIKAAPVVSIEDDSETEIFQFNTEGAYNQFKNTRNIDLYDFIINYKYPEKVDCKYEDKVKYYYQIVQTHIKSLRITEEWRERNGFASPVIYNLKEQES